MQGVAVGRRSRVVPDDLRPGPAPWRRLPDGPPRAPALRGRHAAPEAPPASAPARGRCRGIRRGRLYVADRGVRTRAAPGSLGAASSIRSTSWRSAPACSPWTQMTRSGSVPTARPRRRRAAGSRRDLAGSPRRPTDPPPSGDRSRPRLPSSARWSPLRGRPSGKRAVRHHAGRANASPSSPTPRETRLGVSRSPRT